MSGWSELRFSDYIKMLPSAWVFEHFIQGDDKSRRILSSSLIEEAVANFTNFDVLEKQFTDLSESDQLRCAFVYLSGHAGLETGAFRGLENPLILSFLVYAATDQDGSVRIFGFEEFKAPLLKLCTEIICKNITANLEIETATVWKYRCVNDIAVVLSLAAQKQLKLKKNGDLTRNASLLIMKLTDMGSPIKNIGGDSVANIILEYCISHHMIQKTETEYLLNDSEFALWRSQPIQERFNDIVEFTIEYTGFWWIDLMHSLFERGVSIPLSIFPSEMQKNAINTLKGLRFLGIIEFHKKNGDIYFCKSSQIDDSLQNEMKKVMILPDFSSIIAQEIDSEEIYRFSQLGVFSSLDRVYKGKIDKETLDNALSRGTEGAHILEWLEMWQSPGNVKETVREWLREFYRLFITDRSMLVSADEKVTSQIDSYSPLRSLLEQIPAHTVYRIKKGNEQKVREILTTLGFDHRMPGQDRDIDALPSASQELLTAKKWIPLTGPQGTENEIVAPMRGTKYGGELKVLEMSEVVHVIDYSILTGQNLIIDYEGSPYIKEGIFAIKPLSCQKGIEPVLEAEIIRTHSRKQLYIKKIRKIGVQNP